VLGDDFKKSLFPYKLKAYTWMLILEGVLSSWSLGRLPDPWQSNSGNGIFRYQFVSSQKLLLQDQ